MNEIGNHFKLENFRENKYHKTDLMFSSGRNCLRYILRKRNVKKILIPYFLCETVTEAAINENVSVEFYHIDHNFLPIISSNVLNESTYIYFVNYYGLLSGDEIKKFLEKNKNVIIDNTHDFYDMTDYSTDTIYNLRKYFGIPDGACIVSDLEYDDTIGRSKSLNRIIEFVEREESGKFFHYSTFMEADQYFHNEELSYISKFSENYLNGIDFNGVLGKRENNFNMLNASLEKFNLLTLKNNMVLNFMYPLFVSEGDFLRKYLLEKGIYSILLWPNIFTNGANLFECNLAKNMILLPIDQRYGLDEMKYIIDTIYSYDKKVKRLKR